eukprot:c14671_g2_i1 orf=1-420(-)
MAATPPPRCKIDPHQARRAPETVTMEGTWCCAARSVAVPASPRRLDRAKSKAFFKDNETSSNKLPDYMKDNHVKNHDIQKNKQQTPGHLTKAGKVLKTGEIGDLIQQDFISASSMEKSGSGSPFRIRSSPRRVSPIVEPS